VPTDAENLAQTRTNYITTLAAISANPKPTYSVAGRSFSWTEYQKFLLDMVKSIDAQLLGDDPGELITAGD
jgi:hypothetical protein